MREREKKKKTSRKTENGPDYQILSLQRNVRRIVSHMQQEEKHRNGIDRGGFGSNGIPWLGLQKRCFWQKGSFFVLTCQAWTGGFWREGENYEFACHPRKQGLCSLELPKQRKWQKWRVPLARRAWFTESGVLEPSFSENVSTGVWWIPGFGAGFEIALRPSKPQNEGENPGKGHLNFLRQTLVCTNFGERFCAPCTRKPPNGPPAQGFMYSGCP